MGIFAGMNAVYGWQTNVGGVARTTAGWTPVARCMRSTLQAHGPLCTDDQNPDTSFCWLMKYGAAPARLGFPVQMSCDAQTTRLYTD